MNLFFWLIIAVGWLAAGVLAEGLLVFASSLHYDERNDSTYPQRRPGMKEPAWAKEGGLTADLYQMNILMLEASTFIEDVFARMGSLVLWVLIVFGGPYSLGLALLILVPYSFFEGKKLGLQFIPSRPGQ